MKFLDLKETNAPYSDQLKQVAAEVIDSGWYLLGDRVQNFERQLANYLNIPHVVAVGNGLDALRLILRAYIEMGVMREGDEIIVPSNTYIATILAITDNRLKPVLVEPDEKTFNLDIDQIEQHLTSRTRGIMVVHLYGRCCWNEQIKDIAGKHNLKIIEDNAQSIGAISAKACGISGSYHAGALGDAAGLSFYPTKNLGALGDSGAVATADDDLARTVRALANYGSLRRYENIYCGLNSRMDELQAAFLSVKLNYLDDENKKREVIARTYACGISHPDILLPQPGLPGEHVWHQYIIRTQNRDKVQKYLKEFGIETQVHYPIPPHKQVCYTEWNNNQYPTAELLSKEVLSLPISAYFSVNECEAVCDILNNIK